MATKKKAAKKKTSKKSILSKTHSLELIPPDKTKPKEIDKIKHGDKIKVFCRDKKLCFDITITVQKVPCKGTGGGPIIIHS